MDEVLYNALSKYFHALEVRGYMPINQAYKLLVLIFYKDFVYSDYRGIITEKDYVLIEKLLDCLYGTSCLIPYPDYLKMGKLYLGEVTELAYRVRELEDTPVLKLIRDLSSAQGHVETDIMVLADGVTGDDPDDPNNKDPNGSSSSGNSSSSSSGSSSSQGGSSSGGIVHTDGSGSSSSSSHKDDDTLVHTGEGDDDLVHYLNKRTS